MTLEHALMLHQMVACRRKACQALLQPDPNAGCSIF